MRVGKEAEEGNDVCREIPFIYQFGRYDWRGVWKMTFGGGGGTRNKSNKAKKLRWERHTHSDIGMGWC